MHISASTLRGLVMSQTSLVQQFWRRLCRPMLRAPRRFAEDQRGAVAMEFAILALPFFTLIFAIIETSLVFLGAQILDSAVDDATRLIRTGQASESGYTISNFRTAVCNGLYGMFTCSNLKVNVSVVSNFASATTTSPVASGSNCTSSSCPWTLTEAYSSGSGCSVMLVQVYYKWPMVVRLPGLNLYNLADGTRLLGSVRVVRNEPFGSTQCT